MLNEERALRSSERGVSQAIGPPSERARGSQTFPSLFCRALLRRPFFVGETKKEAFFPQNEGRVSRGQSPSAKNALVRSFARTFGLRSFFHRPFGGLFVSRVAERRRGGKGTRTNARAEESGKEEERLSLSFSFAFARTT